MIHVIHSARFSLVFPYLFPMFFSLPSVLSLCVLVCGKCGFHLAPFGAPAPHQLINLQHLHLSCGLSSTPCLIVQPATWYRGGSREFFMGRHVYIVLSIPSTCDTFLSPPPSGKGPQAFSDLQPVPHLTSVSKVALPSSANLTASHITDIPPPEFTFSSWIIVTFTLCVNKHPNLVKVCLSLLCLATSAKTDFNLTSVSKMMKLNDKKKKISQYKYKGY